MRLLTLSRLCQAIGFSMLSFTISANEQPTGESLVGHHYVGGHGMYISTDNDRLFTPNVNSTIDQASGFGGEFGYRISPFYEARLSFTKLNIDTDNNAYNVPSGSSTAFELLYFPYKKNMYVVAGADFLDVEKSNLSADLGLGYRHYLSENTALYFEGKSHYQFDNDYVDFSSKIGFVYYFGTKPAPIKRQKKNTVQRIEPAKIVEKDTDLDGILDSQDNCANTPATDKVDGYGCTRFTDQQETMHLVVNFENNKSDVADTYFNEIEKVATFMSTYPHAQLAINGHTSSVGDAQYNQQLSEKRAQAIVDVLVEKFSISRDRLTAIGHGENQLLNKANSASAHAQNRRIEATIEGSKKVAEKR